MFGSTAMLSEAQTETMRQFNPIIIARNHPFEERSEFTFYETPPKTQ